MPAPDHPLSLPESRPQPALPLQGLTILAVEDSRFASEALRLLSQRSGARLRRAATMAAAVRHLATYRPDVVIIDLGLPDGDGTELIRSLACSAMIVLGTSGDPSGRSAALSAGAVGFLDKPPDSLSDFQSAILRHVTAAPVPPTPAADRALLPDRLALHDDLAHAAVLLTKAADNGTRRYVAGFLGSVAQSARDLALARAAGQAAVTPAALPRLRDMVSARLAAAPAAFAAQDITISLPAAPG